MSNFGMKESEDDEPHGLTTDSDSSTNLESTDESESEKHGKHSHVADNSNVIGDPIQGSQNSSETFFLSDNKLFSTEEDVHHGTTSESEFSQNQNSEESTTFNPSEVSGSSSETINKKKSFFSRKGNVLFFACSLVLLAFIFLLTVSAIVFISVSRAKSTFESKRSFHYIVCSLNDKRLCDSGDYRVLNDDMTHGFVSFDERQDEFTIVFSDKEEYQNLYSKLQEYLQSIAPQKASTSYGGYYEGGGGSGESFNNMEYLGTGYDVFTGNPLFTSGVDNGFRMNIFDPMSGTTDAKNSLSCDLDFDVYVLKSDSKVRDTNHNVVKINHKQSKSRSYDEYDEGGPADGKQAFNLPTFSLSNDNLKTVMKISTKNRVFAISTTECEIYRMNLIKFDHPSPTEIFVNAVDTLSDEPWDDLSEEEVDVYVDFVEAFGTHVVTRAHMGAKFSYEYEMNKYFFQKEDTHNVQNSLSVLGIDATMIDNQKMEDTLDDLIINMRMLSVGARPVFSVDRSHSPEDKERDKVELWASSAEINPLPIHYDVTAISEYYYYEYGMKVKLIDGMFLPENLENGVREYYRRSKERMDRHPKNLEECEMRDGHARPFGEFTCLGSPNDEKLEWWAARQSCQLWGGDLVTIGDDMKNYFVSENFVSENAWIGYYYVNNLVHSNKVRKGKGDDDDDDDDDDDKLVTTRAMKWVNGDVIGFENFYKDQPDGGLAKNKDNDEFCIQTNFEHSSSWADQSCKKRMNYVCERPLIPPDPSGLVITDDSSTNPNTRKKADCEGGKALNGVCYRYFRESMVWGSAKFECSRWVPVSWDGRLAIVRDKEISEFITSQVVGNANEEEEKEFYEKYYQKFVLEGNDLRSVKMRKYVWIGLTDIAKEGVWKWEDGIYITKFRNWNPKTSMVSKSTYDCVAMNKMDGLWEHRDCHMMKHEFVCQYKM